MAQRGGVAGRFLARGAALTLRLRRRTGCQTRNSAWRQCRSRAAPTPSPQFLMPPKQRAASPRLGRGVRDGGVGVARSVPAPPTRATGGGVTLDDDVRRPRVAATRATKLQRVSTVCSSSRSETARVRRGDLRSRLSTSPRCRRRSGRCYTKAAQPRSGGQGRDGQSTRRVQIFAQMTRRLAPFRGAAARASRRTTSRRMNDDALRDRGGQGAATEMITSIDVSAVPGRQLARREGLAKAGRLRGFRQDETMRHDGARKSRRTRRRQGRRGVARARSLSLTLGSEVRQDAARCCRATRRSRRSRSSWRASRTRWQLDLPAKLQSSSRYCASSDAVLRLQLDDGARRSAPRLPEARADRARGTTKPNQQGGMSMEFLHYLVDFWPEATIKLTATFLLDIGNGDRLRDRGVRTARPTAGRRPGDRGEPARAAEGDRRRRPSRTLLARYLRDI